jgi:hypothetical protein
MLDQQRVQSYGGESRIQLQNLIDENSAIEAMYLAAVTELEVARAAIRVAQDNHGVVFVDPMRRYRWSESVTESQKKKFAQEHFSKMGSLMQQPDGTLTTRPCDRYEVRLVEPVQGAGYSQLLQPFEHHILHMTGRKVASPQVFCYQPNSMEQVQVISVLGQFLHNQHPSVAVNTLYSFFPADYTTATQICREGFGTVPKDCRKSFGDGFYTTPQGAYAAYKSERMNYSHPQHPSWRPVIMCSVAFMTMYPITRQDYNGPRTRSNFVSRPLQSPCDAHFAVVSASDGTDGWMEAASNLSNGQYGEVCVAGYLAITPMALLWVERKV